MGYHDGAIPAVSAVNNKKFGHYYYSTSLPNANQSLLRGDIIEGVKEDVMEEDVKGIISELMKLYDDGKIVIGKFQHAYETFVPTRINDPTPQVEIGAYGIPHFVTRNPKDISEHYKLAEVVEKVDNYAQKWIGSVNDLLSEVEQTRYKLQFNDPNQKGFFASSFGETTPTEDHLYEVIDDLTMRHAELRQIILELERNNEIIKKPDMKDIEPPTYDKKNRTIFFADEAIRFRADASYTAGVLAMIFDKPEKLWKLKDFMKVWDDYYEYIGADKPNDWAKIHQTFKRINERVEKATGIDDLFKFSTTSVRLNPVYLKQTIITQ